MNRDKMLIHESNLEVVRSRYSLVNSLDDENEATDLTKANQFYVIVQIGQDPHLDTNSKTQYIRSVIWYLQGGKETLERFKAEDEEVGIAKGERIPDFFGSDIYRAPNNDGIILLTSDGSHRGQFFGEDLALAKSYAFMYWIMDNPRLRSSMINRVYNCHKDEPRTGGHSHDVFTLRTEIEKAGYATCLPFLVAEIPTTDNHNFCFDLTQLLNPETWKTEKLQ